MGNVFISILLLLVLQANSYAEIEPNNSVGTATRLTSGQTMNGSLATVFDVDWFKIYVSGGKAFQLDIGLRQPNKEILPYTLGTWTVTVYGPDGSTVLAYIETYFTGTEKLTINVGFVGDYLIKISHPQAFIASPREYIMTVAAQSGEPPTTDLPTSDFSGIWSVSTGHFLSVHQNDKEVIAVLLSNGDGFYGWEALEGIVSGDGVILRTLQGYVGMVLWVDMLSPGSLKATQIACTSWVSGHTCAYPNGSTFTATKVF